MNRIGLLYPTMNPASAANWSGTPRGVYDGLMSNGIEVIPIPCHLPDWLRVPVALLARAGGARGEVAHHHPIYARARSVAIASAIRRVGPLDGIVAMGTDLYDLPAALKMTSVPVATYDDGTFELFLRYRASDLCRSGLPIEAIKRWAQRQRAACRFANVACVSTGWANKSVVEDFGVPEQKVRVVGIGHRPRSVQASQRSFESPRFLFVGVDWERKNGPAVIAAFAEVRQYFGQATLDIVGQHPALNSGRRDGLWFFVAGKRCGPGTARPAVRSRYCLRLAKSFRTCRDSLPRSGVGGVACYRHDVRRRWRVATGWCHQRGPVRSRGIGPRDALHCRYK